MRHGLVPACPVSILAGLQEAKFLPGIKGLIGALPCPVRNTIDVFTGTGSAQEIKAMQCSMTVRNNGVVSVIPFGGVTAPTAPDREFTIFICDCFHHPGIWAVTDCPVEHFI